MHPVLCARCVCVCGVTRWVHSAPWRLFCSTFTPPCPYSHCQFLSCMLVSVCSAGLITAEQGLALSPAHSAIRTPRGMLLLLLPHSPRLFFFSQSTRDSSFHPCFCKFLLWIFCWIFGDLWEVWAASWSYSGMLSIIRSRAVTPMLVFMMLPMMSESLCFFFSLWAIHSKDPLGKVLLHSRSKFLKLI